MTAVFELLSSAARIIVDLGPLLKFKFRKAFQAIAHACRGTAEAARERRSRRKEWRKSWGEIIMQPDINLANWFLQRAMRTPERRALTFEGTTRTYRETQALLEQDAA